jgi:5-methyltetrahydropteroyltriglutamate--homocysteine methyltransferase
MPENEYTQRIRADVVGSLLRPPELIEARAKFEQGRISLGALGLLEDRWIEEAIRLQERAGLDVVTDGEFRRSSSAGQFASAVAGVAFVEVKAGPGWKGGGPAEAAAMPRRGLAAIGRLRRVRSLSAHEFQFLREHTQLPVKVTLPAPSYLARQWALTNTRRVYQTEEEFLEAVVAVLRQEVAELAGLGARYLQFDAPSYALLCDADVRAAMQQHGEDPDAVLARGIAADNAAIAGVEGVTFALHLCRGNTRGMWLAEGGYDPIAERLFNDLRHPRFLLEYDTARAGTFAPLRFLPAGKTAVLGLVSTKSPRVETADAIVGRIREAEQFLPLEQLAVSPQCGFASVMQGNPITPEQQEAKLRVVAQAARQVWGPT